MSRLFPTSLRAARSFALVTLMLVAAPAFAQLSDDDPELRVQQLENQLRRLTGQNEELQYRNRQLEDQLRALQGGQPQQQPMPQQQAARPGQQSPSVQAAPTPLPPQQAAPIVQDPAPAPAPGRRRGDAFDPNANPTAPGAPQALGGGRMPMPIDAPSRNPGDGPDFGNVAPRGQGPGQEPAAGPQVATLPPSATPRDEFDLGVGYMQRKDYALAEETMRGFAQKYPSDPLVADSQYWLGESFYQRQRYRESAEVFLGVTTKFDTSGKAPDSLLRLGQSLAALKEKEAACAAFGEVMRKYPRASAGVKRTVDAEQKRVKC